MTEKYASVVLDDNVEKFLDYLIPEHLSKNIKAGMRVEVPLRNFLKKATVIDIKNESLIKNLKPIKKIISEKSIPKDLFYLAKWMAKYYSTSIFKIFRQLIFSTVKKEIKSKENIFISLNKSKKETLKFISLIILKSPLQAKILELFLKTKKGIFLKDILKIISSRSPIDSLVQKKILKSKKLIVDEEFLDCHDYFPTKPKKLTKEQKESFLRISNSLQKEKFDIHLLNGITGSGKTEIYLQLIKKALELKKTALVLIPEIALTYQTIEIFKKRFVEEKIALIHHKKSSKEKYDLWHKILDEKIKIVIGTRSSVFSPLKNIGIIIVDEEHDASYKQTEKMPCYNGKNLAIIRAKFASCPIILGSATPSLESFFLAENKKYILSQMKERANQATLPSISIIDMKKEIKKEKGFSIFCQPLLSKIKERYEKGEQTILFLNRRGYRTFIFCPNCKEAIKCPHCDISLTLHKKENILLCHICEYKTYPLKTCTKCKGSNFKYKGFGTEQVEASLKAIFPDIRTLRIDKDTTSRKDSHETLLKQFKAAKQDVLIGTQMIVKGLHFPSVTLVGILNTDYALNIPDFRSSEKVFQLITQVAGRAGRDEIKGEVLIQTFIPENKTILLSSKQDYETFYKDELEQRKLFEYPPFSKLAKIIFSGKNEIITKKEIEKFKYCLIKKLNKNTKIYPVCKSYLFKYKENFRFSFLVKGKDILLISKAIQDVKENIKIENSIKILIDIDPLSIL